MPTIANAADAEVRRDGTLAARTCNALRLLERPIIQFLTPTRRQFVSIILGCTGIACLLGIGVDLVTANVAVEYFTVHHPRIIPSENPWILAIAWGVAASWWFGAISGIVLAIINQRRPHPLPPKRIFKWTAIAGSAIWAGMMAILLGVLAIASTIPVDERPETFDSDRRLMAVAMAHQYEYLLGAVALLIVAIMTWRCQPGSSETRGGLG